MMNTIDSRQLQHVTGGQRAGEPSACVPQMALGALAGGVVGGAAGTLVGLPNLGALAGEAAGSGAVFLLSRSCR